MICIVVSGWFHWAGYRCWNNYQFRWEKHGSTIAIQHLSIERIKRYFWWLITFTLCVGKLGIEGEIGKVNYVGHLIPIIMCIITTKSDVLIMGDHPSVDSLFDLSVTLCFHNLIHLWQVVTYPMDYWFNHSRNKWSTIILEIRANGGLVQVNDRWQHRTARIQLKRESLQHPSPRETEWYEWGLQLTWEK